MKENRNKHFGCFIFVLSGFGVVSYLCNYSILFYIISSLTTLLIVLAITCAKKWVGGILVLFLLSLFLARNSIDRILFSSCIGGIGMSVFSSYKEIGIFILNFIAFVLKIAVSMVVAGLLCNVKENELYVWYSGVWHGLFAIPNFIRGLFWDNVSCFANVHTVAYTIFYWIAFLFGACPFLVIMTDLINDTLSDD